MATKREKAPCTVTVALKYPVEWGENTYTQLEFRRLKGRDIRGFTSNPKLGDLLDLAQKACTDGALTPKFFDELDAVDSISVAEAIGGFLDSGPATGPK